MKPPSPVQADSSDGVRRRRPTFGGVVVVGLAVMLVAGLAWKAFADRRGGATPLRVGYAIEAPYAFLDEDGRVTGEAPETARWVARRLGRGEPEWVLTEFGSLIGQLQEGRFDVIACGLFITTERERRVAFSRPTATVVPGLLVARGNPLGLHSYADAVARDDVRLAVLAESVESRALQREGMPAGRLVMVPDEVSGVALVRSGRTAGLALSLPAVRWMADLPDSRDAVEVATPFEPPARTEAGGRVAFAFRRADTELRREWDAALAEFMETEERRMIARRFGFADAAREGEVAR